MKTKKAYDVYDDSETTEFIDKSKKLSLKDLNIKLPAETPTKVISLRIPTELYNLIRAYSTQRDIPYQAYIKYLLAQGVEKNHNVSKSMLRSRK